MGKAWTIKYSDTHVFFCTTIDQYKVQINLGISR